MNNVNQPDSKSAIISCSSLSVIHIQVTFTIPPPLHYVVTELQCSWHFKHVNDLKAQMLRPARRITGASAELTALVARRRELDEIPVGLRFLIRLCSAAGRDGVHRPDAAGGHSAFGHVLPNDVHDGLVGEAEFRASGALHEGEGSLREAIFSQWLVLFI